MTVTEVPAEGLTISGAAELSGSSPDTLRYYEKEGLILLDAIERKIDHYGKAVMRK